MKIYATVLIYENIENKEEAFDEKGNPTLEKTLYKYAKNGIILSGGEKVNISYVQSTTGDCDFVILMNATNVEKIMAAVNVLRRTPLIVDTATHIGQIIFNGEKN